AKEHLHLEEPYEWTHPPLGKLIIAGGILCFGMNPFGWRILGVLAAAAMIPIMFLFGKRMFKSATAGFFAAFLMTFDFMHFSLARLATGEIYILLFSLLMFYFAFDYFSKREEGEGGKKSLFLSTIFFGLCFAVKWTAVFGLVAILILLLISNLRNRKPIFDDYKIILAGLFVSAAIYIATYIPYMLSGEGHGLVDIFKLQLHMFGYHAGMGASHPFSSPWWSWQLMLTPVWLYSNTLDGTAMVSTIVLMGNPVIWWCSIPALLFIVARLVADKIRKREYSFVALFILVPFLLQWIPYMLITRILFIYHFVPEVPFMIFALTYWTTFLEKKNIIKYMITVFLILTALLFFLFYPVISGYPVAYEYKEGLRWLSGWIF
ncbi:MAG: glycosyltransferase family 39 protein, partial [Methanophagales archaeon]|nr:glycosyltransferase family 39 protein [Methanophagales archaeon]